MLPHVPVCDVLIYFVHPVGDDWPMPRVYELGFQVQHFFQWSHICVQIFKHLKSKVEKIGRIFQLFGAACLPLIGQKNIVLLQTIYKVLAPLFVCSLIMQIVNTWRSAGTKTLSL